MKIRQIYDTMVSSWKSCQRCPTGSWATKHVFGRGSLQADYVFVGEGPGRMENIQGYPFLGPAGKLLDHALLDAKAPRENLFFTNLVACRPCDSLTGPNRAPSIEEIKKCKPRLQATMEIIQPEFVVLCGLKAQTFFPRKIQDLKFKIFEIYHPSYILRKGGKETTFYKDYVKNLYELFH